MHLLNRDFPVFGDIYRQVVHIDEEFNWTRQDANTSRKEAGMYLKLRDTAAGARKLRWDRMFQVFARLDCREHLAKSFSQRSCKFNLALNELQVGQRRIGAVDRLLRCSPCPSRDFRLLVSKHRSTRFLACQK